MALPRTFARSPIIMSRIGMSDSYSWQNLMSLSLIDSMHARDSTR